MTDYFSAYQRIQDSYEKLLILVESYPTNKCEEPGALGFWSPKQIIDHLSGWVVEATLRYQDIAGGDITDKSYDNTDAFNALSVQHRAQFSWDESIADLKQSVAAWFAEAEQVSAILVARDNRFVEWITALDTEFRNHSDDLRLFIHDISATYPILEFDSHGTAIIEPTLVRSKLDDMPERVVLCFFRDVIKQVRMHHSMTVLDQLRSEIGDNPIYRMTVDDIEIAVVHPGVGAPLAASFLEELIAHGGQKFIACGGAGVLSSDIGLGEVIVPSSAIRDEGTSYHYLPPSREVNGNPSAVNAIKGILDDHDIPYRVGKTWTTDGIYRETRKKVNARRAEGCLTVEMETAAFFAVAQFRDVIFGQLLYGGDDLGGEQWDGRDWVGQVSTREKLFWLAVEAVCKL